MLTAASRGGFRSKKVSSLKYHHRMSGFTPQVQTLVDRLVQLSRQFDSTQTHCQPFKEDADALETFVADAREFITQCCSNIEQAKVDGVLPFTQSVPVFPANVQPPVLSTGYHFKLQPPQYVAHVALDISDTASASAQEQALNARLAFMRDSTFLIRYASYVASAQEKRNELLGVIARFERGMARLDTEMTAIYTALATITTSHIDAATHTLQNLGYTPVPPPITPPPAS